MDGPTHFLTLNSNGTSHATPLARVENRPKPEADAKPSKAPRCTCASCRPSSKPPPARSRKVPPFDRTENLLLARQLGEAAANAERAGNLDRARELRHRELLCLDLEKVEAKEEAKRAGTVAEVRMAREIRGVLTAPGTPSVLDD